MTSNAPTNKNKEHSFIVYSDGQITGMHNAIPGDKIVVKHSNSDPPYTGKIYAKHNGDDHTEQLVGSNEIEVGTSYEIKQGAEGDGERQYQITTMKQGPGKVENGDLTVGSGPC